MFNPKILIISGCVGFIFSFFVGLFSGISFGFVLLRAVICAIILAALSAALTVVYNKFLKVDDDFSTPPSDSSEPGSMVDITVDDELPEEDSAPGFYVDNENIVATKTPEVTGDGELVEEAELVEDVPSLEPASEAASVSASEPNSGFMKSDIQTLTNKNPFPSDEKSGKVRETVKEEPAGPSASSFSPIEELEDLDELPDFGTVVKGTDTSSEKTSETTNHVPDQDKSGENVEAMASAIRTILSKDG